MEIDWESLRSVARDAMKRAYAPYSRFQVGAALLDEQGRIHAGCTQSTSTTLSANFWNVRFSSNALLL